MKILVVDDSPSLRSVMRYMIQQNGWQVIEAENEQDAIIKLKSEKDVDLTIVDQKSPQIEALTVIENLNNYGYSGKKILLSSEDRESFILQAKDLGVSSWLHKPFSSQSFYQAVDHALFKKVS